MCYSVGGTARNGIDYAFLPGELVIPAGKLSAKLIIRSFQDDLAIDRYLAKLAS